MTNKPNRSGESGIDRSQEYYSRTWNDTVDRVFTQTVFHSYPALVSKERVNGYRKWEPYSGGEYDKEKCELVEGMWNHEHCSICSFGIVDDHTYWVNAGRISILCDECHDYYAGRQNPPPTES